MDIYIKIMLIVSMEIHQVTAIMKLHYIVEHYIYVHIKKLAAMILR